jgi:hypothetical protein
MLAEDITVAIPAKPYLEGAKLPVQVEGRPDGNLLSAWSFVRTNKSSNAEKSKSNDMSYFMQSASKSLMAPSRQLQQLLRVPNDKAVCIFRKK